MCRTGMDRTGMCRAGEIMIAMVLLMQAACTRHIDEGLLAQHRNLGKAFYENPTTQAGSRPGIPAGARIGSGFRPRETELRSRSAAGVGARRRSGTASPGGATPGSFSAPHLVQSRDLLQAAGRRESGDRAVRRNDRACAVGADRALSARDAVPASESRLRRRRLSSSAPRNWTRCWRPRRSSSTI